MEDPFSTHKSKNEDLRDLNFSLDPYEVTILEKKYI